MTTQLSPEVIEKISEQLNLQTKTLIENITTAVLLKVDEKVQTIIEENEKLKGEVGKLYKKIQNLEFNIKRNNVIVHGLPETEEENHNTLNTLVTSTLRQIDVDIKQGKIDRLQRIPENSEIKQEIIKFEPDNIVLEIEPVCSFLGSKSSNSERQSIPKVNSEIKQELIEVEPDNVCNENSSVDNSNKFMMENAQLSEESDELENPMLVADMEMNFKEEPKVCLPVRKPKTEPNSSAHGDDNDANEQTIEWNSSRKRKHNNDGALEMAHQSINGLIPEKSRKIYDKCYHDFMAWKMQKKVTAISENVLLDYFQELSDKFKCSSLWSKYSMLKSTVSKYDKVDISKYSYLIGFLKRKSQGFKGQKAMTFSPEQLNKFITEASGREYLLMKIALIFGIMGACRRQELYNVQFEDVKVYEDTILVTIRDTKKKKDHRFFNITGKYYDLCREYIELRPKSCKNPCFFLSYHYGKCTEKRVGINKFGTLGKAIADYLQLPNSEQYTGHCFRRTSATLSTTVGVNW